MLLSARKPSRDAYDTLFATLDELLEETLEMPPDVLAEAIADSLGLPWKRCSWDEHRIEVCLDPKRTLPKGRFRRWRAMKRFASLGESYVTVGRDYADESGPWSHLRPIPHGYTWF